MEKLKMHFPPPAEVWTNQDRMSFKRRWRLRSRRPLRWRVAQSAMLSASVLLESGGPQSIQPADEAGTGDGATKVGERSSGCFNGGGTDASFRGVELTKVKPVFLRDGMWPSLIPLNTC